MNCLWHVFKLKDNKVLEENKENWILVDGITFGTIVHFCTFFDWVGYRSVLNLGNTYRWKKSIKEIHWALKTKTSILIAWNEELGIPKTLLGLKKVLQHQSLLLVGSLFMEWLSFPTFFQNSLLLMPFLCLLHYILNILLHNFLNKDFYMKRINKTNERNLY